MKTFFRAVLTLAVLLVALVAVPALIFAQEVAEENPLPVGTNQVQALVIGVYGLAIKLVVDLLKTKLLPRAPKAVILALPYAIGVLAGLVTSYVSGAAPGGMQGWEFLAASLAGHALNEARSTVKQHGLTGKG